MKNLQKVKKMKIEELLIKHEEKRYKPYDDATGKEVKSGDTIKGKITIGIGRNIQEVGLSDDEIEYLLQNDIKRVEQELKDIFPDFDELPENVRLVLIDMDFNLGKTRFLTFKNMIQAVKERNWETMIKEMKNSRWCEQVKSRCEDDVRLIKEAII